jgi:hypothetical protein
VLEMNTGLLGVFGGGTCLYAVQQSVVFGAIDYSKSVTSYHSPT